MTFDENTRLGPLSPFILKAPPTVSLTNAVASCMAGACAAAVAAVLVSENTTTTKETQNIIPFPRIMAAVPFPTTMPTTSHANNANSDDECDDAAAAGWDMGMPRARVRPRVSQVELRHRRSRARLAQSPLARKDTPRGRSKSPDVLLGTPRAGVGGSGGGGGGGGKRVPAVDVQLLAMVYRTVSSRLGCTAVAAAAQQQEQEQEQEQLSDGVMEAQERLLVQRLSESMVELGCSSFPIVHAARAEATIVGLEYPPLAGCARESSPPPSSAMTRQPVLTMPQLVAKLMLRHGERARCRAANRVRNPGGGGEIGKSSPLVMCIDM